MLVEVKFCGLTRAEDARAGIEAGGRYLGVIFAGGPRNVAPARAREILADATEETPRVGVFGTQGADEIARIADEADVDVVQLHADPDAEQVHAVREIAGRPVWAVLRIEGAALPDGAAELFEAAERVVLDARAPGALGGTGTQVDWAGVRDAVTRVRGRTPLVLAGGLGPEVVGDAIAALAPTIVDVSSGVERAPGIKDHARMRAFVNAVDAAARREQERR